jgi:hypothetical protein
LGIVFCQGKAIKMLIKKTRSAARLRIPALLLSLLLIILALPAFAAGCSLFPSDMTPTLPSATSTQATGETDIISSPLLISEVMSSNQSTLQTADQGTPDWIEIHNIGGEAINLKDYYLSDNIKKPKGWQFPSVTIQAGGYLLVYASGLTDLTPASAQAGEIHASFRLNASGDTLVFSNPNGQVLARLTLPALPADISYGLLDTATDAGAPYYFFGKPTPGQANGLDGKTSAAEAIPQPNNSLVVSEYMTDNRTFPDLTGDLPDWVEIHNTGSEPVSLLGCFLTDDAANLQKWPFPDISLAADAYLLVWLSGKDIVYDPAQPLSLHATFKLGRQDTELILSDARGNKLIQQVITDLPPNVSYGRQPGSPATWLYFPQATPGAANTTAGFADVAGAFSLSNRGVWINEAVAQASFYSAGKKVNEGDWIELHNATDQTVDLTGYGLSDSEKNLYRMKLQNQTIEPGGYLVIHLEGFGIATTGDTLYLTGADSKVIDWFDTGFLANGCSSGRGNTDGNEPADSRYFYTTPTPGAANSGTPFTGTAVQPLINAALAADGRAVNNLYADGPIQVTLTSPQPGAVIRYTLDGNEPDAQSAVYAAPLAVSSNTVIRCRAYADQYLGSRTVSRTFLFDERHDLPVVSLTIKPADFTGPAGLWSDYTHDWEYPGAVDYYEADGTLGVSFTTGVALHGAYSRTELQKSLALNLRECYGDTQVIYPFFKDNKVSTFKRLVLRTSGQDWKYTKLRDAFMSEVIENDLEVETMDWQPCVLYVNGEYYGLYEVRESIDEYYAEAHYGANPDLVDLIKGNSRVLNGSYAAYKELLDYVKSHDLREAEAYQHVLSKIDETSLMDWLIAETFFNNLDSGNKKFWCERSDQGQWRWSVYDMDWAMFPSTYKLNILANDLLDPNGHGQQNLFSSALQCKLMENPQFKEAFIQRYADQMNGPLKTDRMLGILDSMTETIRREMPRQIARWGLPSKVSVWENNVATLRRITSEKRGLMMTILQETFSLPAARMHELFPEDYP